MFVSNWSGTGGQLKRPAFSNLVRLSRARVNRTRHASRTLGPHFRLKMPHAKSKSTFHRSNSINFYKNDFFQKKSRQFRIKSHRGDLNVKLIRITRIGGVWIVLMNTRIIHQKLVHRPMNMNEICIFIDGRSSAIQCESNYFQMNHAVGSAN